VAQLVFFYGTLMTPFNRPGRRRIDEHLAFRGRGSIAAALFDLGLYPAAVPLTRRPVRRSAKREVGSRIAAKAAAPDARVRGEVYEVTNPSLVLNVLDDLEGYRPAEPDASLYIRVLTPVTLDEGGTVEAWTYFYNAPLGRAERIASGDYLAHLKAR
jgi:gamma-glutamylcyclotransferase (GGCT)/AIG2-like uncharacterized protein YtfP